MCAYTRAVCAAAPGAYPPYVRNKLAQLLAALVAGEYPRGWPGAMKEFVLPMAGDPAVRTPASVDLFFRVMRALDVGVTSIAAAQAGPEAREVSVRVKDAIRDDCAGQLVGLLATLVQVPAYAVHAYDLVARYVEWLDIALFTNDAFLPPIYAAITAVAPAPTRAASAYALRAIVGKRMAMPAKMALLQHLQILQLLAAFPPAIPPDDGLPGEGAGHDAPEPLPTAELAIQSGQHESALLVNCVANFALDGLRALLPGGAKKGEPQPSDPQETLRVASAIAEAALPLALRFVEDDSDETVSQEALKCVTTYINVFGRLNAAAAATGNGGSVADGRVGSSAKGDSIGDSAGGGGGGGRGTGAAGVKYAPWTHGRAGLDATLVVIKERACFPPNYDPMGDDEEDPFKGVRYVLLNNVVRGLVRAVPTAVLDFTRRIAAERTTTSSVPRTELVLTLLKILAEIAPDLPGLSEALLSAVCNPPVFPPVPHGDVSAAVAHQVDAAHLAHMELVVRVYRLVLLSHDRSLLSAVLAPFFDVRGLRHPSSAAVRSRAAYLLLKLTRPLRTAIASQHLDAVMSGVRPLMFPILSPSSRQVFADQMNVFEIAGYLIGTDSSRPESVNYLSAVIQAIVEALQASTTKEERIGLLTAAGQLSKGFGYDSKPLLLAPAENGSEPTSSDGAPSSFRSSAADGRTAAAATAVASAVAAVENGTAPGEYKIQKLKPVSEQSLRLWTICLETILATVGLMGPKCSVVATPPAGMDPEVREKTIFMLHRMVDTMGDNVIPYLGAVMRHLLHGASSATEVNGFVVLASQAVSKFGKQFEVVVTDLFADTVTRIHQYPVAIDPTTMLAMSEEARECVELRKSYFYFIHAMLGGELVSVLTADRNVGLLPAIISSVVNASVGQDMDLRAAPTVMKMALSTIARVVQTWVTPFGSDVLGSSFGESGGQPRGLVQYVTEEVASACVRSCVVSNLFRSGDFSNGGATAVITENVMLQRTCAMRVGQAFGQSLQARAFANHPQPQDVTTYVSALYAPTVGVPELAKMFLALVKVYRSVGNNR